RGELGQRGPVMAVVEFGRLGARGSPGGRGHTKKEIAEYLALCPKTRIHDLGGHNQSCIRLCGSASSPIRSATSTRGSSFPSSRARSSPTLPRQHLRRRNVAYNHPVSHP